MTLSGPDLLIGVHDLLRRPGTRLVVHAAVDLDGLAISTASVPAGSSVDVEVILDSINDGVVLTTELDVLWVGECRRCLEPASGTTRLEVHEVYRTEPTDDMLPIEDETIDVAGAIRDAALLGLPIAPLCAEDCQGPAPGQFPVIAATDVAEPVSDPRWAALDQLRFDSIADSD